MALTKLKRARNSLLNVSTLPPEVLGNVFRWNVTLDGDFGGLERRSHNFLHVCHHWFEVASSAPELWGFWGNTPQDWARWCHHSGTAPLDLVLNIKYGDDPLGTTLYNVLQDRATQDTIRRVHLKAEDPEFLTSIIASITANSQEVRSNNVESLILWNNNSDESVDISDFFSHYHLPKLERLQLVNCTALSWDFITSRSPVLTTLDLSFSHTSPSPITSQLLSILASYPTLQEVSLFYHEGPGDGGGNPSPRVSLCYLKKLKSCKLSSGFSIGWTIPDTWII